MSCRLASLPEVLRQTGVPYHLHRKFRNPAPLPPRNFEFRSVTLYLVVKLANLALARLERSWNRPTEGGDIMDVGIALPTPADSWKTVKRAEDAGFQSAWFYDTQVLSADIFVAMGAAAVKTARIRVGTGVLIPSNRIAPVAANGLATLNALAPGRVLGGFGTGFTGRRTIGLGAYRLSDMADYIGVVSAMLRGETPELRIEGQTRKVRFLNPDT